MYLRQFFIMCLLFCCLDIHASPKQMLFATDPWPPYFLESTSEEVERGIGIRLLERIFHEIPNVQASFPKVPWKRALIEVEQGKKDGIALLLQTPERSKFMAFSRPLIQTKGVLLYHRARFPDGIDWTEIEELQNYRFGVVAGYSYGDKFDAFIAKTATDVIQVTSSKQLFSMLRRHHIDLIPETAAVAFDLAREQGWAEQLGVVNKAINTDILHIGVSRLSEFTSLIPDINIAIEKLTNNGEIGGIVGRHAESVP